MRGRVDAVDAAGSIAGSAVIDDVGRYAIGLAPGSYTLRVVTDGTFPRCPQTPVTVTPEGPTTANIDCDTGIR